MKQTPTLADIGQKWLEDARMRATEDPSAKVVMAYSGAVDHAKVQELIAEAEAASLTREEAMPTRKRMINVLVEGLENVHHHSLPSHREAAFVLLVREDSCYRIAFGNTVPMAMAALILHRVGIINEMDEADLKEHYLKLLSNSARSEHGGAGLGLLTMARKSAKPMIVRTAKLCPEAAFLTLELRIEV
jgi:Family of unknown function (DUF6272)